MRVLVRDLILLSMILVSALTLPILELFARRFSPLRRFGVFWGDWFGWIGVSVILQGLLRYKISIRDELPPELDPHKETIVIGTHTDPPGVFFMLYMTWYLRHAKNLRRKPLLNGFVPRDDLNPLLLLSLQAMGAIPIPRERGEQAKRLLSHAVKMGPARMYIIYPDGTRPTEAKLRKVMQRDPPQGLSADEYKGACAYTMPWRHGGVRELVDTTGTDINVVVCTVTGDSFPRGKPFFDVLGPPKRFDMCLFPATADDLRDRDRFNQLWVLASQKLQDAGRKPTM